MDGWHLKYLGDDQHVRQLDAFIENIRLDGNKLRWDASGGMSDEDGEEGYEFCYYYTVIAWNQTAIDSVVSQDDNRPSNFILASSLIDNEETALVTIPDYILDPAFTSKKVVAILPRGFGFGWNNESPIFGGFDDPVDHHLLQVAFNLDHSEIFVEQGKDYGFIPGPPLPSGSSLVGSGFVTWETFGIFKDNSAKRSFFFGETVSALAGNSIGLIQPPFAIRPVEDTGGGCISTDVGVISKDFSIENIPFDQAIPMLTGWDLQYCGSDQHVKEIGIWLSDIRYDKPPGALVGTLRYKLNHVLCDNDCNPGSLARHKVTILGLQPAAPIVHRPAPDLVPVEIAGSTGSFCKQDSQGRLVIRIKNQGDADAPASRTSVEFFPGGIISRDTPAIPVGGSIDLIFEIPPACFGSTSDCHFKICSDSNNQINESNEGNNCVNARCVG